MHQYKLRLNPVAVSLDNKIIGKGYISEKGNTMVPLRILSETLNYKVKWDDKEKEVTISKDDTYIKLTVGYHNAKVNDGIPYQISFSQVVPEMQLVTLSLHENNEENLGFAKLLLNSLVPTKANEIYSIISTQDIIPLKVIKSDGYQVGILAQDNNSSLELIFDASKEGQHINNLKRDIEANKGR